MGSGWKAFTAAALTSADVNGYLMDQSVCSFADNTARDAATPQEGMVAFVRGDNELQVYTGGAWANFFNWDTAGRIVTTGGIQSDGVFYEHSTTNAAVQLRDTGTAGVSMEKYIHFEDSAATRQGYMGMTGSIMYAATDNDADIVIRPGATNVAYFDAGTACMGVGTAAIASRKLHVYTTSEVPIDTWLNRENTTNANIGMIMRLGANNGNSAGTNDKYISFRKGDGTEVGAVTGTGSSGVTYDVTSDARLKTSLEVNPDVGDIIDALIVRKFVWDESGVEEIGVFAQEAFDVYAPPVNPGDDGEEITKTWMVDHSRYVGVILAELKTARAERSEMQNELAELRSELAELREAIG